MKEHNFTLWAAFLGYSFIYLFHGKSSAMIWTLLLSSWNGFKAADRRWEQNNTSCTEASTMCEKYICIQRKRLTLKNNILHASIHFLLRIRFRVADRPESIATVAGREAGYTPHRSPASHKAIQRGQHAQMFTSCQFRITSSYLIVTFVKSINKNHSLWKKENKLRVEFDGKNSPDTSIWSKDLLENLHLSAKLHAFPVTKRQI